MFIKRAHYTIQNILQLDRSAPPKEVQATKKGPSNPKHAWILKHVLESDLFYAKSTNVLTVEEKTNLLNKKIHGTACNTINLRLYWRARSLLITEFTLALKQGFPFQSHFVSTDICRPKKPKRFLWKQRLATGAFGRLSPADCVGTPRTRHGKLDVCPAKKSRFWADVRQLVIINKKIGYYMQDSMHENTS
jgi:hypothetical protein